jgi:hypothetical protein
MGRWYRNPKRISLRPLVRDSGCTFALEAASFTVENLALIRKACKGAVALGRIQAEGSVKDRSNSILIVAVQPEEEIVDAVILREGWRAVVVVDSSHGIDPVVNFLTYRTHYKLTARSWVTGPNGELPPFVLSMNVIPAQIQFAEATHG